MKEDNAYVLFDPKGIILHELVPKGQNVTDKYYLEVVECLWKRIVRVKPEYWEELVSLSLFHDNALPHKATSVGAFLVRKQVSVLQHPSYLPYLSSYDYFLCLKLKLTVKGTLYDRVAHIQYCVTKIIVAIPKIM